MTTETQHREERIHGGDRRESRDLLIVGTQGGGGIHRYVDEQADLLDDEISLSVYDMTTTPAAESGTVLLIRSFIRALWAAFKFPFRRPYDVVHVHTSHRFSFYRASFYVLFAAYVWRRPVVVHIHGSSFDKFVHTDNDLVVLLQRLVFGAADRIIVLSEYWRDVVAERAPEDIVSVLPNAVDPSEYDPSYDADPPHLVFVSNLIARKGVRELVSAIDALQEEGVDFRASIAGSGPYSEEVSALDERYEYVQYLGYVSEAEKRELLSGGTVFALPAYAEGLPIALLEGMAGGNAVVSTAIGSIPEVVGDENGILVEPGDAAELRDALERLLTSPDEAERMARRNRSEIEEQYSWERTVDGLERLYEDVGNVSIMTDTDT